MTDQEILDNAPEGATHIDHLFSYWLVKDRDAFNWHGTGWQLISSDAEDFRSLADIKRIAELESILTLVRKDLLMRSEEDSGGCKVVNLSSSVWVKLKEALKEQVK